MKAPDKMYIGSCDPSLGRGLATASVEKMKSDDIKYIRKDALLEWANDNLLECEVSNDDTDYGRIDVYKKLIDKLNSL